MLVCGCQGWLRRAPVIVCGVVLGGGPAGWALPVSWLRGVRPPFPFAAAGILDDLVIGVVVVVGVGHDRASIGVVGGPGHFFALGEVGPCLVECVGQGLRGVGAGELLAVGQVQGVQAKGRSRLWQEQSGGRPPNGPATLPAPADRRRGASGRCRRPRLRPPTTRTSRPARARGRRPLIDRLPEGERSDTWLTYGEQKHHVHLSHAFTTLGDTRRANESQQRALELSAPTSAMTRTLLNIDGAACAHHDGDTEQACRRTVAALTALPVGYRTGLVRRRALHLYEAIPTQHHRQRAVRELRNVLAAREPGQFTPDNAGWGCTATQRCNTGPERPIRGSVAGQGGTERRRYKGRTISACGPFEPWVTSNSTRWFSSKRL